MADDVDPNTIPPLMPAEQPIAKENGRATTAMLNWLSALRNWTKKTVVDLRTKITTLSDGIGDLWASLTVEETARIDGDTALASVLAEVNAKADKATANGQIYFAAKAGPSGSSAAFGVYLEAGDEFTGMELLALSGGGGGVAFSAAQFILNDSGSAQNVFNYSGGLFTFNVPVLFFNGQIDNGAVTNAWAGGGGTGVDVPVNFRGSGFLEIYAQFDGDAGVYNAIDQFALRVTDVTAGVTLGNTPITQAQNGTGSSAACRYGATPRVYIQAPAAGARTYRAEIIKTIPATPLMLSGVTLVIKEYSK